MEYAYATCLLNETDAEINEQNLKAVLAAAGSPVQESRIKAVVAALEDIQLDSSTTGPSSIGAEKSTKARLSGVRELKIPEPTTEE